MFFSMNTAEIVQNHFSVSVPLRGYVFLNPSVVKYGTTFTRFRPLTGICFSQLLANYYDLDTSSFRPLTGICFSQFLSLWH